MVRPAPTAPPVQDGLKKYFFKCDKWLGLDIGDNLIERTLVASETDPRAEYTDYTVGRAVGACQWTGCPP